MSVKISSWAWHSTPDEVKGNKLIALLALADIADDQGVCRFADDTSQRTLAAKARMSVSQFREVTHWLEENGYIESTRESRTSVKTYRINATADFRRSDFGGRTAEDQRSDRQISAVAPLIDVVDVSDVAGNRRGTRMVSDWVPSEALLQWAVVNTPSVGTSEFANFVDYWLSVPGQRGVKLDWDATWRTWMRRAHERNRERGWVAPVSAVRETTMPWWCDVLRIPVEDYLDRRGDAAWVAAMESLAQKRRAG